MKPLCTFLLSLSLGLVINQAAQAELPPILVKAGTLLTQPDLKQPLGPEWSVGKGKWEPKDGVIIGNEIPEEHHAAVLHLKTGAASLVFEAEFKMDAAKVFYIGCDGAKHVGRLVVVPKSAKLCEDSTEVKGKTPSDTLAETAVEIKADDWVPVRVEYTGDQLLARVGADHELKAQHPYLATSKSRWWIAAGGGQIEVRNIRVSEGVPTQ